MNIINTITNYGLNSDQSVIQQRRIRLLNVIALFCLCLCLFFSVLDMVLGAYIHSLLNLAAIFFVVLPTILLNKYEKSKIAITYFVLCSIAYIVYISSVTIGQARDTDTENVLMGFSVLVIVLYDNPRKIILFAITTILLLGLKLYKHQMMGWELDGDFLLMLFNMLASLTCIYLFTGAYKSDLVAALTQLKANNEELESKQNEILKRSNELIRNKQLMRSMIDNVPVFLALLDNSGHYLIVNKMYEMSFGIPVSEIEGKHFSDVLPEDLMKVHQKYIEKCIAGHETEFTEYTELPEGEGFFAHGKYKPIKNDRDEVQLFVVYVDDITKLKQAESELRYLNTTKDKLLSIVSHDLKSPIRSLQGLLSISDSMTPGEFQTVTEKIERQVQNVSFTMDNLLNWVKSQLSGFQLATTEVDLISILNHCCELYSEELATKGIILEHKLNSKIMVTADPEHVHLVFRNILSNAIKFTPQGGTITLYCREDNDEIEFVVKDTGVGIPESKLRGLLSNELHTSEQGTSGEQGTGLGLALCIDILNLNRGSLKIQSSVHSGTSVHIFLPSA